MRPIALLFLSPLLLLATPAAAQDESGDSGKTSFAFGGIELSETGYFGYLGGGLRIGGDLDTSGPMVRAQIGHGQFDHAGPLGTADGKVTTGNLMLGYQFVNGGTRVSLYAGGDYQDHDMPSDPANPVAGEEWGGRFQAEVYTQADALMALAIGSYSTANESYFLLGKVGLGITDSIYVGPMAGALGNERFDQWRIGGHVTGFRVGPVGLGAEVGYVKNNPGDDGIFGSVGFTLRF